MTNPFYTRLKNWLDIEKRCPPEPIDKESREYDLRATGINEAFFELGRLRLENRRLKGNEQSSREWLERAKEQAGYDTNVSFDVVWEETLALANLWKEQQNDKTTKQG